MVDTNEKPSDIIAPENIAEHKPTVVNRDLDIPEKVEKRIGGTTIPDILAQANINNLNYRGNSIGRFFGLLTDSIK